MSRLTKFIESLQKNVVMVQSKSTNSQYFEVGAVKIRVSDHFSEKPDCCDIQIVIPINSKTIYLCRISEGVPVMTYTLKELKQFITNYVMIGNIKAHTNNYNTVKEKLAKEQSEKDKAIYQQKQEELAKKVVEAAEADLVSKSNNLSKLVGFDIDNCVLRTDERHYSKCTQDIKRQIGLKVGDLSAKKKKLIRSKIVGSNIPWIEVIKLLKEANSNKILKGSANTLEAWILTKFKN